LIAAHPEYEVVLKVEVSEDGTMRNPQIIKTSGDSSFDRAAIMAIHKTKKIPPPPENWKANAKKGIIITLSAQDK
jgi:TonB family protein